jgi:uncharacterized protein GlcG (DUF336 family)
MLRPPSLRLGLVLLALAALLANCGGGGSGPGSAAGCDVTPSASPQKLEVAEVEGLVARAIEAAFELGADSATVAVTDRVGNVLAIYRRGDAFDVTLDSGRGVRGGLEQAQVPAEFAAISKALTGAYLSSSGNAFSTRTASFIVQEHFIPGVLNQPAGPLYGVQFSQLPCGDLVARGDALGAGPRRSPLGLAADPGGFPLYKNGRVVGGIGVVAKTPTVGSVYGLDLDPIDVDTDLEERAAQSALGSFAAPACIRADRITVAGLTLRYSDSDARLVSPSATAPTGGAEQPVAGWFDGTVRAGLAYGDPSSGFVLDDGAAFASRNGMVLTDGTTRRFPPVAATTGGLTGDEVTTILQNALDVANETRAQIRRPLNSPAEVTITVVDAEGNILGLVRTPDAPVFGTDVSVQKARTAAFFSKAGARSALLAELPAQGSQPYLTGASSDGRHADAFFGSTATFTGGTAFSARAIGNVHRPYFPDGILGYPRGPLSTALDTWSPFNVGLQLDLVQEQVLSSLGDATTRCTKAQMGIDNGIQIFPGGVPIYRGGTLIGGIGVSGDGIDQDDMVAFLGLDRARATLGASPPSNAPATLRADRLATPLSGTFPRYVQCPQSPFINSSKQDACAGI